MSSLACWRCDHEGFDVEPKIVDLEAEAKADGGRVRMVEVEVVTELRHVDVRETRVVPEVYASQPRCRDRVACDARYAALMAAQAPAVEEDVPWA